MTNLKYRFIAQYKDGSIYQQNETDTSIKNPERSAFYDVVVDDLLTFTLENKGSFFTVNLVNGCFETNAGKFRLHEGNLHNFRLVYFRRVVKDFDANSLQEVAESVTFFLGWKALTEDNKEIEHTIRID